jgi:hypothetical protein
MRNHSSLLVKKVKHAIIDLPQSHAQLAYFISEQFGLRTPKLMPQLCQPLDANDALELRLLRLPVEPRQQGACPVVIRKKQDLCFRHHCTFTTIITHM